MHRSATGFEASASKYLGNGNAVRIRDGRAAVSVCSDPQIGNPRRL